MIPKGHLSEDSAVSLACAAMSRRGLTLAVVKIVDQSPVDLTATFGAETHMFNEERQRTRSLAAPSLL